MRERGQIEVSASARVAASAELSQPTTRMSRTGDEAVAQKREDRALGALVVVAHERIYPGGSPARTARKPASTLSPPGIQTWSMRTLRQALRKADL